MKNYVTQLENILKDKKHILISFDMQDKGDTIAGSIALADFLEKKGKQVDIVADKFDLPKGLKFLKKTSKIKTSLSQLQKFIITVNTSKTGIHELSYDHKNDKLRIFVTPEQNHLTREDIKTAQSDFKYDIIFILGTQNLENLGALYENNTELFYKKPIINIDNNTTNEHFGALNIVDITTTSTSEILFNLMQEWQAEKIDANIATALLAGMIISTRSFKQGNIKPQTLGLASKLMHLGADRDHIVQNLYRTRSLSTLKLWGQALTHLQHDKNIGLVWTTITRDDMTRSGAETNDLYEIVDELIGNSPEAKLILLLQEQNDQGSQPKIQIILTTTKNYDAGELLSAFTPTKKDKNQSIATLENKTIVQAEKEIIEHIRKKLEKK